MRLLPRTYAKNKDFLRDPKFPYLWGLKKISFYQRLMANRDKTMIVRGRRMPLYKHLPLIGRPGPRWVILRKNTKFYDYEFILERYFIEIDSEQVSLVFNIITKSIRQVPSYFICNIAIKYFISVNIKNIVSVYFHYKRVISIYFMKVIGLLGLELRNLLFYHRSDQICIIRVKRDFYLKALSLDDIMNFTD